MAASALSKTRGQKGTSDPGASDTRDRLRAAIAPVLARRGFPGTTVTEISDQAGLSRRVFYEYFESERDCFADAYATAVERIEASLARSPAAAAWPEQVAARVKTIVDVFAADRELVALCLTAPPQAGDEIATRQAETIARWLDAILAGPRPGPDQPSPGARLGLGGALVLLLAGLDDDHDAGTCAAELTQILLAPFLGQAQARSAALAASRS